MGSIEQRVRMQIATAQQVQVARHFYQTLKIWVLVTGEQQRIAVADWVLKRKPKIPVEIFSVDQLIAEADQHELAL